MTDELTNEMAAPVEQPKQPLFFKGYAELGHVELVNNGTQVRAYFTTSCGPIVLTKDVNTAVETPWQVDEAHAFTFQKSVHKELEARDRITADLNQLLNLYHKLLHGVDEWCNTTFLLTWCGGFWQAGSDFAQVMTTRPAALIAQIQGHKEFLSELGEWASFDGADLRKAVNYIRRGL